MVITYLGVAMGRVLLYYPQTPDRLKRWIVWGLVLGAIAMGLSGGTRNGGVIPINKNLWSVSFVLALAGMGPLMLSVCYVLVDVLNVWNGKCVSGVSVAAAEPGLFCLCVSGAPFIYPGMNSIAVYVGSELCQPSFPFSWAPLATADNTHGFMLTQNLIAVRSNLQLMLCLPSFLPARLSTSPPARRFRFGIWLRTICTQRTSRSKSNSRIRAAALCSALQQLRCSAHQTRCFCSPF